MILFQTCQAQSDLALINSVSCSAPLLFLLNMKMNHQSFIKLYHLSVRLYDDYFFIFILKFFIFMIHRIICLHYKMTSIEFSSGYMTGYLLSFHLKCVAK